MLASERGKRKHQACQDQTLVSGSWESYALGSFEQFLSSGWRLGCAFQTDPLFTMGGSALLRPLD